MHIPFCVRLLLHKSLQIAKLRKDEIPFLFCFCLALPCSFLSYRIITGL